MAKPLGANGFGNLCVKDCRALLIDLSPFGL